MVRRIESYGSSLSNLSSIGDYNKDGVINGADADDYAGGGFNYKTSNGTHTLIVVNSKIEIGDFKDSKGYVSGEKSNRAELLAHEMIGHGLTHVMGGNQWKNAILLTNLYRRVQGSNYYRDGNQHGGRGSRPVLNKTTGSEIPAYLQQSKQRSENSSRGRIRITKKGSEVIKY